MLETIRQFKPTWVVGENVRGIINWNGGLVFEQVQVDLEAIGYEVQAFILPACSIGAPHRRDRVWFVAYCPNARAKSVRRKRENSIYEPGITSNAMSAQRERKVRGVESKFVTGCEWVITYTKSKHSIGLPLGKETQYAINGKFSRYGIATHTDSGFRCQRGVYEIGRIKAERHISPCGAWAMGNWDNFPTQPPLCGRDDGISSGLVGITFSRHRRESIQAYGNAIVPQVAYQIFKAINDYERKIQH